MLYKWVSCVKKVFAVIFKFFDQNKSIFYLILNKLEKIKIPAKTFSQSIIPITMT